MKMPCELCDDLGGKRRDDNIYVCDECDDKYPIPEFFALEPIIINNNEE